MPWAFLDHTPNISIYGRRFGAVSDEMVLSSAVVAITDVSEAIFTVDGAFQSFRESSEVSTRIGKG